LLIFFGLFVWGADLYVRLFQPPSDALKIYVIGKQWMWKVEHQGGQREINALHLPVGRSSW
jgi:cytochrome c oxidase subunit 2